MILTFGKYKHYDIEDVPNDYLEYLLDNSVGGPLFLEKIEAEMKDREAHKIDIKGDIDG